MSLNTFKITVLLASMAFFTSCNNKEVKTTSKTSSIESSNTNSSENSSGSNETVIALFDNDSLLVRYNYSKDIEEKIRRKERSILANRESKMKDFQDLYQTLNQKAPTMTQLEAQQAEQQLLSMQQELDAEDQQTQQKYIDWKTNILVEYQTYIDSTLESFREVNNIDILVPSGGGITKFYYKNSFDVTDKVVDFLNNAYNKDEE